MQFQFRAPSLTNSCSGGKVLWDSWIRKSTKEFSILIDFSTSINASAAAVDVFMIFIDEVKFRKSEKKVEIYWIRWKLIFIFFFFRTERKTEKTATFRYVIRKQRAARAAATARGLLLFFLKHQNQSHRHHQQIFLVRDFFTRTSTCTDDLDVLVFCPHSLNKFMEQKILFLIVDAEILFGSSRWPRNFLKIYWESRVLKSRHVPRSKLLFKSRIDCRRQPWR